MKPGPGFISMATGPEDKILCTVKEESQLIHTMQAYVCSPI